MKISAHCNITNPESMGYPYLESIKSFANVCDEVIIVDGGSTDGSLEKIVQIPKVKIIQGEKWEREFDWKVMAKNLQIGYEACEGDWAFHFDVDYIFHEDYVDALRKLVDRVSLPAIELRKVNFVLVNEFFTKDYFPLLIHKKGFQVIGYGIGIDEKKQKSLSFLRPIVKKYKNENGVWYGDIVKMSTARLERSEIPIFTYDFTFMTKEQVAEQRFRFENSLKRCSRTGSISKENAFEEFVAMMRRRHQLCRQWKGMKLEKHSKFIRDKVKDITPDMFGHSFWGMYLEN